MRLVASFLLLLTFSLQSYLVQTHIHLTPAAAGKQAPQKDDPANCPICQDMAQAGHFLTPAAASLLLPSAQVSIVEIVVHATVVIQGASHTWRSRAPPKA